MKILLITIGIIALLLTSCEKDEMNKGGLTGGGMANSTEIPPISISVALEKETPDSTDNEVNEPDSLSYNSNKFSDIE